MQTNEENKMTVYVVQWFKPSGMSENTFTSLAEALEHFNFERENPVVTKVVILERTEKQLDKWEYGGN